MTGEEPFHVRFCLSHKFKTRLIREDAAVPPTPHGLVSRHPPSESDCPLCMTVISSVYKDHHVKCHGAPLHPYLRGRVTLRTRGAFCVPPLSALASSL